MNEQRFWILARGEEKTESESVVSTPWWPEAAKWMYRQDVERVDAPLVFTTEEEVQKELRILREEEEHDLVERLELAVDRALHHHHSSLHAFEISRESLASKLKTSDFLCVMVDGRLRLRRDFIEELSTDRGALA